MKRKKLLIGSFIAALACVAGGVGMAIPNDTSAVTASATAATKTVDQVSLVMKNGASVRYASSATDSGIRFSVNLSLADYLGLEANDYVAFPRVEARVEFYDLVAVLGELHSGIFASSA